MQDVGHKSQVEMAGFLRCIDRKRVTDETTAWTFPTEFVYTAEVMPIHHTDWIRLITRTKSIFVKAKIRPVNRFSVADKILHPVRKNSANDSLTIAIMRVYRYRFYVATCF